MKLLLTALLFLSLSVNGQVIVHKDYTIYFDSVNHGPEHTEYWLTRAKLKHVCPRPVEFTNDPDISLDLQGSNEDYRNSGYDKGHLSPADDFRYDEQAEKESMYLTNVAPQNPYFNEHLWKNVEDHVREMAEEYDSVHVFTGVHYSGNFLKGVGIPDYYWKEIEYNGTAEFFKGENVKPESNDYKSIEVSN